MSPALAVLEDFSTYDLSRVAQALVEVAEERPTAPALHALRGACIARLSWDMAYRQCWADPTFLPRYLFLRQAIVTGAGGEHTTVALAIPVIDQLVQDAVRLEYSFNPTDRSER